MTSTSTVNVDVLANYFRTKIATIHQLTSGALRSNIEPRNIEPFTSFQAVTVDEVITLLHTLYITLYLCMFCNTRTATHVVIYQSAAH